MINLESPTKQIETDTASTNPWDYVAVSKDQSTFDTFDISIVDQSAISGSIFYNGRNQFPVQITLRCELDSGLLSQWQTKHPHLHGKYLIPRGAPVIYDTEAATYWVDLDRVASDYSVVYLSDYLDDTNSPLSTDSTSEWFVSQIKSAYATLYTPDNASGYTQETKEEHVLDNQSDDGFTTVYLYVSANATSSSTPDTLDICLTVIVTPTGKESITYSAGEYTLAALSPNHDKLLITAYPPKTYNMDDMTLTPVDAANYTVAHTSDVYGTTLYYPSPWPVDQDNYYFYINPENDEGFIIVNLDTSGCTNIDSGGVHHQTADDGSLFTQITEGGKAVFSVTSHESSAWQQIIYPLGTVTSEITQKLYNFSRPIRAALGCIYGTPSSDQQGGVNLTPTVITLSNDAYPNSVCLTRLNYNVNNPPGWAYSLETEGETPCSGANINCSPNLGGDYDYGGWFGNFIIYDQYGNSGSFYIVNPNKNGTGGNGNTISINSGTDTD
ncbi:hypothetical protein [Serratia quinivorans]|uniref:hypothetical protein n=1 Tax=Serratia quinivorans TaxID=137545 RepID=UPI0034C69D40